MKRRRKWEDMETNCLANIFSRVGLDSLIFWVPLVCKSWHTASLNPLCWKVISFDFLSVHYHPFNRPPSPKFRPPKFKLENLVKLAVERSRGSSVEFILPPCLDDPIDLVGFATKCPALKILCLPDLSRRSAVEIKYLSLLICNWKELEWIRLVSPPSSFKEILTEINRHCHNFRGIFLNRYSPSPYFDETIDQVITALPLLKSLIVNGYCVRKDDLVRIIADFKELENLQLVRCFCENYQDQRYASSYFNIRVNPKEEKVYQFEMITYDSILSDDKHDYDSFILWTKNKKQNFTYTPKKERDYCMLIF